MKVLAALALLLLQAGLAAPAAAAAPGPIPFTAADALEEFAHGVEAALANIQTKNIHACLH